MSFGLWIFCFGFWVLGFGFWVLGLGFGGLGVGIRFHGIDVLADCENVFLDTHQPASVDRLTYQLSGLPLPPSLSPSLSLVLSLSIKTV